MEPAINNISDITYMFELTLDIFLLIKYSRKCQGLNLHL